MQKLNKQSAKIVSVCKENSHGTTRGVVKSKQSLYLWALLQFLLEILQRYYCTAINHFFTIIVH